MVQVGAMETVPGAMASASQVRKKRTNGEKEREKEMEQWPVQARCPNCSKSHCVFCVTIIPCSSPPPSEMLGEGFKKP